MNLLTVDYLFIISFFLLFFFIIRKAIKTPQVFPDYFNGGENVHWLAIAITILSINTSVGYLVGASTMGYSTGLAFGSYEWTSIFVIIFASLYIIPKFIRSGILTLPEYLELRFDKKSRIIMAIFFLIVILSFIILDLESSALLVQKLLNIDKIYTITVIALIGGGSIYFGGANSRIKLNYILVSLFFILGSLLIVFCLIKAGGISEFYHNADGRLKTILPADNEVLPWPTVFLGGLWILHLNYWCFNPPINQAALGTKTLSQMQKGLLLVASVKILIPFIMIIPGIVGFELYKNEISDINFTLPVVVHNVVPAGLVGIFILGFLGSLFAAFSVLLNTATTIFSLDIYGSVFKNTSGRSLITVARIFIISFLAIAIVVSYFFHASETIFKYGTIVNELIAPISASVFMVALYSKRTPPLAAHVALIGGIPIFLLFKKYLSISSINLALLVFIVLTLLMLFIRLIRPLAQPVQLKEKYELKFERNLVIEIWSIFLITLVCAIYLILG